jgi:hypothetical protein
MSRIRVQIGWGLFVVALITCPTASRAAIIFSTGTPSGTGVNLQSFTNVSTVLGNVGSGGPVVSFQGFDSGSNLIGLDTNNGLATIFADAGSNSLFTLVVTPASTSVITDGGFSVTTSGHTDGTISFAAYDASNNAITVQGSDLSPTPIAGTFQFSSSGEDKFNFTSTLGSAISKLVITADVAVGTFKQFKFDVANAPQQDPPPATPEPASLAIWGLGVLGCAVVGYRRRNVA